MKFLALTTALIFSTTSFATSDMSQLKKAAVQKFLAEANNPKTKLAKRIDQINAENSDGRNPDGTIEVPVKAEDLQVVTLTAEELYNPWHYAEKSEDEKTCLAGGDSATFLVLLSSHMGVHGASEFETYAFSTSASGSLSAVRKDGKKIEYCEDIVGDQNNEFIISAPQYSVEDFQELEIKVPSQGEQK